ncbi:MAG: Com family DNA-binding transcriptional regulator [[Clostridium] leptum]
MIEFRCPNCNKLLGKIDGVAEIKCPRCRITFRMDNRNKIVIERLNAGERKIYCVRRRFFYLEIPF